MIFPPLDVNTFSFQSKKDVITSSFSGYVQTRPKYSRAVKIFSFSFVSLTKVQADKINDFLVETRGLSFTFIHPLTSITYEVRLLTDLPEFTWEEGYFSSSSITLEEV